MNPRPATFALFAFLAACSARPAQDPASPSAGPRPTSVTVYPVVLVGRPSREVAKVVGILLEKGGMQDVRVETTPFQPDAGLAIGDASAAFGAFVKQQAVATDRSVFVDVRGTPGKGASEIRTVLVDRDGRVLLSEQQQKGDAAFDAAPPREPMDCCVFVARRLQGELGIDDPLASDRSSKLEASMRDESGVPTDAEQSRMHARMLALQDLGKEARIRVWPARVGGTWPTATASALVARLQESGRAQFTTADGTLPFTAQAGMNEQRTIWSGARSIQAAIRKLPASTDYHLVCDFLPAGKEGFVAVHTYLLAPDGELVLVDYQNDHHADFRAVDPTDQDGCCELAARRVLAALRGK